MTYDPYRGSAGAGAPPPAPPVIDDLSGQALSFPEFYRQQREREQHLDAIVRNQVGRYTRRSPSDSPPTGISGQSAYGVVADGFGGAQPAYDAPMAFPATFDPRQTYTPSPTRSQDASYHSTSPPGVGPVASVPYHSPSPPQDVYNTTPSPLSSQGSYTPPQSTASSYPLSQPPYATGGPYDPMAQATGLPISMTETGDEVTQDGLAHYRSHVFKYPTSRAPVYSSSEGLPRGATSGVVEPWATTAPPRVAPPPEEGQGRKRYTRKPLHVPPPAPSMHSDEPYMREAFSLSADMDLTLGSLRDPPPGERPNYPLPLLCALAVHGSAAGRLTLQGIFEAIEERFEWYRENADKKSWKNSVRHLLSLHKIFRQEPRPITEPGKGHYWKLDFSEGVGNKRERKRRPRNAAAAAAAASEAEERSPSVEAVQRESSAGPTRSRSGPRPRPVTRSTAATSPSTRRTSPTGSDYSLGSHSSAGVALSPVPGATLTMPAPPVPAPAEYYEEPIQQFGQTGFGAAPAPNFSGFSGWPTQ